MPFPAQVEQWRSLVGSLGSDLPTDLVLAWFAKESGGNVCATGIPGVEAGLAQTFHPADDRFGMTFSQLRAPCSGQSLTQQLSPDQAAAYAAQAIAFIRGKRDTAAAHLAAVGANWSRSSADFWIAVKQEHALPCVMSDLLPRVTAQLGRPPSGWTELRTRGLALGPIGSCAGFASSPSQRGLSNRLEDTMANAEEVGQFGAGFFGGNSMVKLALAGVLLWGVWELTR